MNCSPLDELCFFVHSIFRHSFDFLELDEAVSLSAEVRAMVKGNSEVCDFGASFEIMRTCCYSLFDSTLVQTKVERKKRQNLSGGNYEFTS